MSDPRIEVSTFLHYQFIAQDETERVPCGHCGRIGGQGTKIEVAGQLVFSGCNHCLVERLLLPPQCCGRVRTHKCQCGD